MHSDITKGKAFKASLTKKISGLESAIQVTADELGERMHSERQARQAAQQASKAYLEGLEHSFQTEHAEFEGRLDDMTSELEGTFQAKALNLQACQHRGEQGDRSDGGRPPG